MVPGVAVGKTMVCWFRVPIRKTTAVCQSANMHEEGDYRDDWEQDATVAK